VLVHGFNGLFFVFCFNVLSVAFIEFVFNAVLSCNLVFDIFDIC